MPLTPNNHLIIRHLAQYVSDHKKEFIQKVLDQRTRHVTVALEDIYQPHNTSAVIRTCECMGIQDVHIIEKTNAYETSIRVLKGSHRWINLIRHRARNVNNTEACFNYLRKHNYTIYAADPSEEGVSIHDLDPSKGKIAIMFGNELRGVSEYALTNCDQRVRIPMYGFTESLNISVSAAICLNSVITKMHGDSWSYGLTDDERNELTLQWYRKVVRKSDVIEREFLRTIQ